MIPLSYSSISTFEQCPHKFYRTRITKDLPEAAPHPSAVWGSAVHKALEDYIRDQHPMPTEFAAFEPYARDLRRFAVDMQTLFDGQMFVEHKLAVDNDLQPVDFDDAAVRYRGIVDYLVIAGDRAFLLDHKTGKIRPSNQLALNALLIFSHWPQVERVHAAFFWLAERTYTNSVYARQHALTMEKTLFAPVVDKIDECMRMEFWPKRQSGLCKYCPVVDCEFRG